jgi:hypothetical protein
MKVYITRDKAGVGNLFLTLPEYDDKIDRWLGLPRIPIPVSASNLLGINPGECVVFESGEVTKVPKNAIELKLIELTTRLELLEGKQ